MSDDKLEQNREPEPPENETQEEIASRCPGISWFGAMDKD